MALNSKELKEKRAKLIVDARQILDTHADEAGNLGAEHQAQYDRIFSEAEGLGESIKRLDQQERLEASLSTGSESGVPAADPDERPNRSARFDKTSQTYQIRSYSSKDGSPVYLDMEPGRRGTPEYREMFASALKTTPRFLSQEVAAALQSDDAEQAGYLVASEQFAAELLKEVDDLLFIRRYARIHTVREASSLGIRKRTARMSTFGWSAEIQAPTADTALKFGKKSLTPHYLSGSILVSNDLLRRAVMGAEMIVREEMARDAGEVMEDAFLTGNGSQQPLGVFTASSDGISTSRDISTDNTTTAITADGLINAKYALKSQYRKGQRGAVRWLFHRDAIKLIAKLKDGEGNYLFNLANSNQPEDMLLGYPVDESERAPNTFTTGLYVGLLANWRYYEIADALDMEMRRLEELNARTNQVEFIGRLKTDGMPTLEEAFVRVTLA